MPRYLFRCPDCHAEIEVEAAFSSLPQVLCSACEVEAKRVYQVQICTNRWVSREENRLPWVSDRDMMEQRREWDRRYEQHAEQIDPPEQKPMRSLVDCAKETGLIS